MNDVWNYLGPDFAVKAVGAGLAALLFGVIRRYRHPIANAAVSMWSAVPSSVRRRVRVLALRRNAESTVRRGKFTLEWRLANQQFKSKKQRFQLIGPTYLDVTLSPIDGIILESTEVSNLDALSVDVGGSAIYVGRYLYEGYGCESFLYTRLGARDELRKELKTLIKRQHWIKSFIRTTDTNSQSAISVHLMQRSREFYTTLTHKGAASSLGWEPHRPLIKRRGTKGGTLIITGLFRTNLTQGLCTTLAQMPPRMVIILDNGLFRISEHSASVPPVLDAFSRNLIDVYICSMDELEALVRFTGNEVAKGQTDAQKLSQIAGHDLLPRVTVVRGPVTPASAEAHILVDGTVSQVKVPASATNGARPATAEANRPGTRNALTAGIAFNLIDTNTPQTELVDRLVDSVSHGLKLWLEECE